VTVELNGPVYSRVVEACVEVLADEALRPRFDANSSSPRQGVPPRPDAASQGGDHMAFNPTALRNSPCRATAQFPSSW
jgi:hypothetical protein